MKFCCDQACFIHVANMASSHLDILSGQLKAITENGWGQLFCNLFIGCTGKYELNDCSAISEFVDCSQTRVHIFHFGETDQFEFPTLNLLHSYCKANQSDRVLYLHSKGVSHYGKDTESNVNDWRELMQYFLINHASTCMDLLNSYDACGVNYQNTPWPHFSGNMWWARADWIAKLKKPVLINERRDAESWLLSEPDARAYELYNSRVNHYLTSYPKVMYGETENGD